MLHQAALHPRHAEACPTFLWRSALPPVTICAGNTTKDCLMPGETNLHKTLKKEACHWLFRMGYRCIAAEVRLRPLGIIDAVGTGLFKAYHNYLSIPRALSQVCFIECKASRADFLRDMDEAGQFLFELQRQNPFKKQRRRKANPFHYDN